MNDQSPIVHIGLQKTASTFLQRKVFGPMEEFHTPWGEQSANAIEHFVLRHPERLDIPRIRKELEAPDGKVTVISQEDMIGYPIFGRYYAEQTIRRLSEALPSARILLVIREQRSMLLSNYFQSIRQGGTLTLQEMLEPRDYRPGFRPLLRLDHFEYDLTYSIMTRFFNEDQILVIPYELLREKRAEFIRQLRDFTGVYIPADAGEKSVHERRAPAAMRVERFLNRIAPNPVNLPERYDQYPLRMRTRNRIVNVVDRVSKRIGVKSKYLQDLEAIIEHHVGNYFDESNRNMSEILGIDLKSLGYPVADRTGLSLGSGPR